MYSITTLLIAVILFCYNFASIEAVLRCIPTEYDGVESNLLQDLEVLPRCVSPVENLLTGRFRHGIHDGGYESTVPPWFNVTLATIGQKFAQKYMLSAIYSTLLSALVFSAQPDISGTLFYSGGMESLPTSIKRQMSNILQLSVWYKEDLFSPQSNLHDSLTHVRSMHLVAMDNLKNKRRKPPMKAFKLSHDLWTAFEKDLEISDIENRQIHPLNTAETPYGINQFGMAITLWGFTALPFIRPAQIGLPPNDVSDEDLEGFLHLLAYIGHALGTEDEFNVCLQPNAATARIYFEKMLDDLLVPQFFHLTYEAKVFIEMSVMGFAKYFGPEVQFDFILRRILEDVFMIPCPNLVRKMTPMGRIVNGFWKNVLVPGLWYSKSATRTTNFVFSGYLQNLSLRLFGFDGMNMTVVAEHAWPW